LYATADPGETSRPGELRFRTLPQQLSTKEAFAVRAVEGISVTNASFQTIPLLSTPCDLFAFGVLAARTLLTDDELTLPMALDELLSLARQTAAANDPSTPLGERVAVLMKQDPARAALLGPQRLLRDRTIAQAAAPLFPADLWWDAIAFILRLFPGACPESFCRDFGDAPPLALETVFEAPLSGLEAMIHRARALLFIDWSANREINSVIRSVQARHGGSAR
jgi:hypothetical protein